MIFNKQKMYRIYPFGGAVYYKKDKPQEYTYELTPLRKYICHKESWEVKTYKQIAEAVKSVHHSAHGSAASPTA